MYKELFKRIMNNENVKNIPIRYLLITFLAFVEEMEDMKYKKEEE